MSLTSQKPTGVFVRLPLSNEQLGKLLAPIGTLNERMISIGTPVTGGELQVVAYDNIASGYLSRVEPVTPSINLVRQSDAQAQIAALEAEVVCLREALDRIRLIPFPMMDLPAGIMHGIAHKALKGGAA